MKLWRRSMEEIVDQYNREIMYKTIAQQRAKRETYDRLTQEGLPIPADLKNEIEATQSKSIGFR